MLKKGLKKEDAEQIKAKLEAGKAFALRSYSASTASYGSLSHCVCIRSRRAGHVGVIFLQ